MERKILLLVVALSSLLFIQCNEVEPEKTKPHFQKSNDTIYVDVSSPLVEKIKVSTVDIGTFSQEIVTAGTIKPIPNNYAAVSTPFSGRMVKSFVKLGQSVNRGTPLFEVVSPDYLEAQKEYFEAKSERDMVLKDFNRKQDLYKNGVASEKEIEEATKELNVAEKELERADASIRIFNVNPDTMVFGHSLIVVAPIAGKVIENNVINGQFVKDDDEPVIVIADISKVWVTAQVKEKNIGQIQPETPLEIKVAADNEIKLSGKVFYVSESVDEETRSVNVLSECDNMNNQLKLGMFVNVHFSSSEKELSTIPVSALLQDIVETFVYVEVRPNVYVKQNIKAVETIGDKVYVNGLKVGQKVISKGGYMFS